MVYWKSKVGYINYTNNFSSINESDITWTDDSFFVILETNVDLSFQDNYGTGLEIRSLAENLLGQDVDYIYSAPPSNYPFNSIDGKFGYAHIKEFFPSVLLSAKNAFRIKENNTDYIWCVYIEKLNRLILSVSGKDIYFYSLSEHVFNRISQCAISSIMYHVGGGVNAYTIRGLICNSYNEPSDLIDKNKMRSLIISSYITLSERMQLRIDTIASDILINLFGTTPVEPDGSIIPPENPYEPVLPSLPGDLPPGTFDDSSDPIPDSSLPTISAANTGFTRIYNPTLAQVQQLAKYLWTDDTVIETIWNHIKQYFEDPMQAIIGFNLVPVPVPDGGTQSFALMYIDTGVEMTVASNQFVDVDCGTLAVERYYGSALDQSPYTKITCFLPYIGQVQLDTDEVMGTTLQVKYRVDIVTGSCVAKIFVDGNCLYQYTGHCAINIPISSADFSSYVSSAISIARLATTAGLAASGIVAPPTPVTTTQQTNKTTTTNTDTARNPATGRQITMGTHTTSVINETNKEVTTSQASFDGLSPQNISNTVGQIMGSKAIVQHSGSFSGNSGYLGVRRPYLIIERPNICLPANYQQLNGYPAMITMSLGSCQGYTQVQQVQLTGLTATNPEQAEILSLLKGGVIF